MEFIRGADIVRFAKNGVTSEQLLFPENSASRRVTITRVSVRPGAVNARHAHADAEQVWVALHGSATLLLAGEATMPFAAGDVVRFAEGDVHGLANAGAEDFVYLSVTAPPQNFRSAYAR